MKLQDEGVRPFPGWSGRWVMDGVLLGVHLPRSFALPMEEADLHAMQHRWSWLVQRLAWILQQTGGSLLRIQENRILLGYEGEEALSQAKKTADLLLTCFRQIHGKEGHGVEPVVLTLVEGPWMEVWLGDHAWKDRFVEGPALRRLVRDEGSPEPLLNAFGTDPREIHPSPPRVSPRVQWTRTTGTVLSLQIYRYPIWPPDVGALQHTLLRMLYLIRAHGGIPIRLGPCRRGQQFLVLFEEKGEGDAAYQAIRAALEMTRARETLPYVRAGVERGDVLVGEIVWGARCFRLVQGDESVGIATRLMNRVQRNQVGIGPGAYRCVDDRVVVRKGGWIQGRRGRARRTWYQLMGVRPGPVFYEGPLVERQVELKKVLDAVRQGRTVGILGETGAGKTRLLRALQEVMSREEWRVFSTRILPAGGWLHPFKDLLATWAHIPPDEDPSEQYARLLQAFQQNGWDFADRYVRVLKAMWGDGLEEEREKTPQDSFEDWFLEVFLQIMASDPRTVWLVDDLHHLHPDALSLWLKLVHHAPRGFSVVFSFRGEQLPERIKAVVHETVALHALSETGVMQMVEQRLFQGAPLDVLTRATLWNVSRGNPLLALAYAREARERQWVRFQGDTWIWAGSRKESSPMEMKAVFLSRFRTLDPALQDMLQVAAVARNPFPIQVLERILSEPVADLLQEAVREGWVEPEGHVPGSYGFVHEAYREAILHALPLQRRKHLHAEIARVYEEQWAAQTGGDPADVAYHYLQAGMEERAIPFLLRTAKKAFHTYRFREASVWYARAWNILRKLEDPAWERQRLEALLGLAKAMQASGRMKEAKELLQSFLEKHPGSSREGEIRVLLGSILLRLGDEAGALQCAQSGIGDTDLSVQIQAWNLLGQIAFFQGRYGEAQDAYRQGMALAEKQGDAFQMARFLHNLGLTYQRMPGAVQYSLPFLRKSIQIFLDGNDPVSSALSMNNLALSLIPLGRFQEAREWLVSARFLAEKIPYSLGKALAAYNLGSLSALRGDFLEAEALLKTAYTLFSRIGHARHLFLTLHDLLRLAMAVGDRQGAARWMKELMQTYRHSPLASRLEKVALEYDLFLLEEGEDASPRLQNWVGSLPLDVRVDDALLAVRYFRRSGQPDQARTYLLEAWQRGKDEGYLSWIRVLRFRMELTEDSVERRLLATTVLAHARRRDWISLEWRARVALYRADPRWRTYHQARRALERQLQRVPSSHRRTYLCRVRRDTPGILE